MELIASNGDANDFNRVLSSSPERSTVTFTTYEEIALISLKRTLTKNNNKLIIYWSDL